MAAGINAKKIFGFTAKIQSQNPKECFYKNY